MPCLKVILIEIQSNCFFLMEKKFGSFTNDFGYKLVDEF